MHSRSAPLFPRARFERRRDGPQSLELANIFHHSFKTTISKTTPFHKILHLRMAGASDKARFYLEQYVPELQEYQRKEIFTHEEIVSIASKRSGFEHTLNARGSKPSDYARYATYEMNVDSLRKKRCKRLGVKSTAFNGPRTIFFILERGTKKFPGDMGLWMQYIQFCQKEKANKKLAKVFTNALRLKPREWGLWVLAAKHYAETQGDMSTARSYLQRGLRFCREESKLWVEYVRLEMGYLAKLAGRRRVLGLDDGARKEGVEVAEGEDLLELPAVTAEDINPDTGRGIEEVDDDTLKRLASAPAFTAAIPMAIFDAAMKQFNNDAEVAEEIFNLCASFDFVPSTRNILQHILSRIQTHTPNAVETVICESKMQLLGIETDSPEFPSALGTSLAIMKRGQSDAGSKGGMSKLAEKAVLLLLPYLRRKEVLDEDVVTVLEASTRRYIRLISQGAGETSKSDPVASLLNSLRGQDKNADAKVLEELYSGPGGMDLG